MFDSKEFTFKWRRRQHTVTRPQTFEEKESMPPCIPSARVNDLESDLAEACSILECLAEISPSDIRTGVLAQLKARARNFLRK